MLNRRRWPTSLIVAGLVSVTLTLLGAVALWDTGEYHWIGDQTGYSPVQPIAYSHRTHAQDFSMPCEYCHYSVRRGAVADIPPAPVCMQCHAQILTASPEVQKISAAVRTGQPPQWVHVYRLPDFVYFDHSAHVTKGVSCSSCHGPVEQMERIREWEHLNMGWCITCHRQYTRQPPPGMTDVQASTDCSTCHF